MNASGQRAFRPVHVEGIIRDAGELAFEKGILLKAFRGEVFLYKVVAAFRFFDDEHHILLENITEALDHFFFISLRINLDHTHVLEIEFIQPACFYLKFIEADFFARDIQEFSERIIAFLFVKRSGVMQRYAFVDGHIERILRMCRTNGKGKNLK